MTNLLVAMILGLLASVHSTPVNTVTLTNADNDVFQEAMENEFLIPSLNTQTPKNNPSTQASQLPPSDFKKGETTVSTRDTDGLQSTEETGLKSETEILDSTNTDNLINEASPALSSSTPGTAGDEDSDLGSGMYVDAVESNPAAKITVHTMSINNLNTTLNSDIKSGRGAILEQNSASTVPPATKEEEDLDLGSGMYVDDKESTSENQLHTTLNSVIKSGRGAILDQNSASVSSATSGPINEASAALSTSTVPPATEEEEDLDLGSGIYDAESTNQQSTATNSNIKSRRGHILDQNPATTSSPTSTPIKETSAASLASSEGSGINVDDVKSTASSTAAPVIEEKEIRRSNIVQAFIEIPNDNKLSGNDASSNKEHRTPGWIVILACVMGVAVLVIVCVAFVTKRRWYGPSQVYQVETKTGQQREQELETFLQNDTPKENRTSAEYTVIPLDDLPQSYKSHATH